VAEEQAGLHHGRSCRGAGVLLATIRGDPHERTAGVPAAAEGQVSWPAHHDPPGRGLEPWPTDYEKAWG
jgi:hypothetical protein